MNQSASKENNAKFFSISDQQKGKIAEVVLVYGLAVALLWIFGDLEQFGEWQNEIFGRKILNKIGAVVVIPVLLMFWYGRGTPPSVFTQVADALKTGTKALLVMVPVFFVFPIVTEYFEFEIRSWGGGIILGAAYAMASVLLLLLLRSHPVKKETGFSITDAGGITIVFGGALGLLLLLYPFYPMVGKLVIALIFVGFLEEFFFRGYLQPRLNEIFSKPFVVLDFRFGWGIILASLLFGLIHVLSPGNPWHWGWGLWTFFAGISFGILREKGGSFLAPALVHGLTVIPPIMFS